jgi:anti-sigma regulatory factor (Ser/Thr protein kinase)
MEQEWAVPESEVRQILVIIEELFSNIIRFAFEDHLEHMIEVRLVNNENHIEIETIDDGKYFNPLEHQKGPLSDPFITNEGGMGLTLIKTFSSSISYQRIHGKNHLFITKRVKSK